MLTRRDFFKLATGVLATLGLGRRKEAWTFNVGTYEPDTPVSKVFTGMIDDAQVTSGYVFPDGFNWWIAHPENSNPIYSDDNGATWQDLPDDWYDSRYELPKDN